MIVCNICDIIGIAFWVLIILVFILVCIAIAIKNKLHITTKPKTQWIPVSERLPETDNENSINNYNVLLWVKNKSHPEREPQIPELYKMESEVENDKRIKKDKLIDVIKEERYDKGGINNEQI